MVLLERRTAAPTGFVRQGAAPANATIALRVGLTSNNAAGLEETLKSVSTSGNSDFRQWLSMDEPCLMKTAKVKTFTQPSSATVSAFNTFATANGLTPTVISPNGDWVSITLNLSQANRLVAAEFTPPSLCRCRQSWQQP
ncbi:Pro-kumamolisin, activation domain-containing protein [Mycena rosella]|uniref:Pro-kumamolisin, activation domain-containing protein n=1 Tax=Mycena rosella TaxID=1033263 RepID=A0AAD7FME1_MYCRO|nr:Pro-kumamolisin, activation domain-containing protein [Mycena rosella]